MKTLYLIRHADSSWSAPNLTDHDRPLSARGERDKVTMAKFAKTGFPELEILYSSSAARALEYAVCIHQFSGVQLQVEESLYTFSSDQLIEAILALPDAYDHVGAVTHNPATTEVLNELANFSRADKVCNVPTAAIAVLEFDVQRWNEISMGTARLIDFARPSAVGEQN